MPLLFVFWVLDLELQSDFNNFSGRDELFIICLSTFYPAFRSHMEGSKVTYIIFKTYKYKSYKYLKH